MKKVTFYGPVMTTRGERLGHVKPDATSKRRTMLSSVRYPSSSNQFLQNPQFSLNRSSQLKSREAGSRPHSKTTVIGNQLKTRMNCNHLRPKCQCSASGNKKKLGKGKYKVATPVNSRQSHILTSTRTLPRGGTDGRKNYNPNRQSEPVSILDATWKPSTNDSVGNDTEKLLTEVPSSQKVGERNFDNSGDALKKKVQFADRTNSREVPLRNESPDGSEDFDISRSSVNSTDHLTSIRKKDYYNQKIKDGIDGNAYEENERPVYSQGAQARVPMHDSGEFDSSTSYSDPDSYCRLCELSAHQNSKKFMTGTERHHLSKKLPDHHKQAPPTSSCTDPCVMCHRQARRHCHYDEDYCQFCEHPCAASCHHPLSRSRVDTRRCNLHPRYHLHRNLSSPHFHSDIEDEKVIGQKIPYEPKTKLVQDLKDKLEADYKSQRRQSVLRRRWRSWDAEDLDDLRHFHLCNTDKVQDVIPQHRCVHRYRQNGRLFLDATHTDAEGRSLCNECGAPQPTNPREDPYLYHITLGGLKSKDNSHGLNHEKENNRWQSKSVASKANKQTYESFRNIPNVSRTLSGDTSKHVFAKLNRNINSIFPGGSHCYHHSMKSKGLHNKRNPGKSMALFDHLL